MAAFPFLLSSTGERVPNAAAEPLPPARATAPLPPPLLEPGDDRRPEPDQQHDRDGGDDEDPATAQGVVEEDPLAEGEGHALDARDDDQLLIVPAETGVDTAYASAQ